MELRIGGSKYIYTGEVNQEGAVCGEGSAFQKEIPENKLRGTFLDGMNHGISKSICKIYTTLFTSGSL